MVKAIPNTYLDLVRTRKECRQCKGLTNPAVCARGAYDSDDIGPWSRWHGDLGAKLMIIGQDWGDEATFIKRGGIEDPENRTNKALTDLVRKIGLDLESVFLTNAILCLKQGGMQAAVKKEWFRNCGELFLARTIEILKPKILVTLGERAYRSVEMLFDLRRIPFRRAVESREVILLAQSIQLFPMYHCGARGLNINRLRDQQEQDWLRIKPALS